MAQKVTPAMPPLSKQDLNPNSFFGFRVKWLRKDLVASLPRKKNRHPGISRNMVGPSPRNRAIKPSSFNITCMGKLELNSLEIDP